MNTLAFSACIISATIGEHIYILSEVITDLDGHSSKLKIATYISAVSLSALIFPFPLIPRQTLSDMITATILAALAGYVVFEVLRWFRLRQLMPPGPLGLPWIGNKNQVPSSKPWVKFEEWNRAYGP